MRSLSLALFLVACQTTQTSNDPPKPQIPRDAANVAVEFDAVPALDGATSDASTDAATPSTHDAEGDVSRAATDASSVDAAVIPPDAAVVPPRPDAAAVPPPPPEPDAAAVPPPPPEPPPPNAPCVRDPQVTPTDLAGNPGGGSPYQFDCAPDQVLVGVRGFAVGSLGGVAAYCQTVERQGAQVVPLGQPQLTAAVGPGQPVDALCPAGTAIVGFSGNSGLLVDAITPLCAPLVNGAGGLLPGPNRVQPATAGGLDGGGSPFQAVSCPGFAVGIYGGAGDALDSFGLRCGQLTCGGG